MKVTKKMLKLAKKVWENKEDGCHAWYKYYNNYICLEVFSEENESYILVTLTDKIDFLGYHFGETIDFIFLNENDLI